MIGREHRPPLLRRLLPILRVGPLLVLLFLFEGLAGKARLRNATMPTVVHMAATAVALGALALGAMTRRRRSGGWNDTKRLRWIKLATALMIYWALAGTITQEMLAPNALFWSLWAFNLFAVWWLVPPLLEGLPESDRILMMHVVFAAIVLGSLLFHPINGVEQGRLIGMFANATHAGRLLAFSLIFYFALFLNDRKTDPKKIAAFGLAAILLLLTRTRGAMGAAMIGCSTALFVYILARPRGATRKAVALAFPAALLLLGAVFSVAYNPEAEESAAGFLRIEGGADRVIAARTKFWDKGIREFWDHGLFGEGFLSKFGDTTRTYRVFGMRIPRYDWTLDEDPHNMFFLTAQQQGVPAVAMLVALLAFLWRAQSGLDLRPKCLMAGFLAAGVVFGAAEGNWLTSFGHPTDRLCFVMFAAFLSLAPTERARNARGLHSGEDEDLIDAPTGWGAREEAR